jgi:hypothetical protein
MGNLVAKLKFLRQKANIWKKTLKPDRAHLNTAKITLDLIDWIEEKWPLTFLEGLFRKILKKKISSLIHLVANAARQVGKLTWCALGDEDTRFYHSQSLSQT